jgi:hypothetical protein
MTIDKDRFLAGLAVLAGAFGREIDGPVQRAYYAVLNPKMTNEQFETAIQRTLEQETFWPSPAVIAGKVLADEQSTALLAFEHVNRVMSAHGGYRYLSHATYHEQFDAPTKAAISAVGGLAEITNTSAERWPSLQRRFASAYIESKQPRIAAPQTDGRVLKLVASTADAMPSGRDRAAGVDR